MTKIYRLKDPITLEVRYVGKTVSSLEKRLGEHISYSKKGKTHRDNWIKSLPDRPIIELIEECDDSIWEERERYWITYYKARLTNHTDGGEGMLGNIPSIETRQVMSKIKSRPVLMLGYSGMVVDRFPSIKEAARYNNLNAPNIGEAIRKGARGSAGSYRWAYEDSYDPLNPIPYTRDHNFAFRPVTQYDLQMNMVREWSSTTEAASVLGIKKVGITKAKCGALNTYKGFIWK